MGNSGIEWVDHIFDWCVILLVDLARLLGVSYEEINLWVFVVIWPLLTIGLMARLVVLTVRCRRLEKRSSSN
jgi:hypothetical protein